LSLLAQTTIRAASVARSRRRVPLRPSPLLIYNPLLIADQARIVMTKSEKDRLAQQVADLRITFDLALSDKRKYPEAEFNSFVAAVRQYIKITAGSHGA
jgi:hypothetical protein